MAKPRVLALIPARGGSKGIPRKNLVNLGGHPLVAWSIAAARAARSVDRIILSTDDAEIAATGCKYGAEVPFMRPARLATDTTPDLPVFQHALSWLRLQEGEVPDIVVHLRPTHPLRRPDDIDRAVQLLLASPAAHSVRSVIEPYQNPFKMWRLGADGLLRPLFGDRAGTELYNMPRQQLPAVLWHNGCIDAIRRETIEQLRSMTGSEVLPIFDAGGLGDIDDLAMLDYVRAQVAARDRPELAHLCVVLSGHSGGIPQGSA